MTFSPVALSRFPVGSSASRMRGLGATARAIATVVAHPQTTDRAGASIGAPTQLIPALLLLSQSHHCGLQAQVGLQHSAKRLKKG